MRVSVDDTVALGFKDRFGLLVDAEWTAREQRKLQRRLHSAKLRYPTTLEAVPGGSGTPKAWPYKRESGSRITARHRNAGRNGLPHMKSVWISDAREATRRPETLHRW